MVALTYLVALLGIAASVLAGGRPDGNHPDYVAQAATVFNAMHPWYDAKSGLWQNEYWISGNTLIAMGDMTLLNEEATNATHNYYNTAFTLAGNQQGAKNFINDYYDDESWWALAWIRAYDVTGDAKYLQLAENIFQDLTNGWGATCGGHWWNKGKKQSNNAIANSLFMQVAASLANRVSGADRDNYFQWAMKEWAWIQKSGLINQHGLINDGLNLDTCKNNKGEVWTYNQGTAIGALAELSDVNGVSSEDRQHMLEVAARLAKVSISHFGSQSNGIMTEPHSPALNANGAMFKGVFVRNLPRLHAVAPQQMYVDFLTNNANTMWAKDRNQNDTIGPAWQGSDHMNNVGIGCQTSGLDLLVAAARAIRSHNRGGNKEGHGQQGGQHQQQQQDGGNGGDSGDGSGDGNGEGGAPDESQGFMTTAALAMVHAARKMSGRGG